MKRLLLLLVLPLTVLFASCGDAEKVAAPSPGEVIADSARALATTKQSSVHYKLAVAGKIDVADGAPDDLHQYDGQEMKGSIEGGVSRQAITAKVTGSGFGTEVNGQLLAGQKEVFVQLMGKWYGDKTVGLDQLVEQAKGMTVQERQDFNRDLMKFELAAPKALDMTVVEGPEIDGQKTWKVSGSLNANGIADLIEMSEGDRISAQDRKTAENIFKELSIEYVVGQSDNLPRSLKIRLNGRPSTWGFSPADSANIKDINSVDLSFKLTMDKWGQPVSYQEPSQYAPFNEILEGFAGLLGQRVDTGPAIPGEISTMTDGQVPAPGAEVNVPDDSASSILVK